MVMHLKSENLLNEIRQIIYSLYQAKESTEKLYNNIMNLIKLYNTNKTNTTFMNLKSIKTSDSISDKINLKKSDKYVDLLNLSTYYTSKNIKKLLKNNKFETSAPTWSEKFELLDGYSRIFQVYH